LRTFHKNYEKVNGGYRQKRKEIQPFPKCYYPTFSLNDKVFWAMGGEAKENI